MINLNKIFLGFFFFMIFLFSFSQRVQAGVSCTRYGINDCGACYQCVNNTCVASSLGTPCSGCNDVNNCNYSGASQITNQGSCPSGYSEYCACNGSGGCWQYYGECSGNLGCPSGWSNGGCNGALNCESISGHCGNCVNSGKTCYRIVGGEQPTSPPGEPTSPPGEPTSPPGEPTLTPTCSGVTYSISPSNPVAGKAFRIYIDRASAGSCNENWNDVGSQLDGGACAEGLEINGATGYYKDFSGGLSAGNHTFKLAVNTTGGSCDCVCNAFTFNISSPTPTLIPTNISSPTPTLIPTPACIPSCALACGQANGCGGFCAGTDLGVPAGSTIVSPAGTAVAPTVILNSNSTTLTWEQNTSSKTDYYYIERSWNGTGAMTVGIANTTLASGTLAYGQDYYWRVRAVNETCEIYEGLRYGAWSTLGYFVFDRAPSLIEVEIKNKSGKVMDKE